MNVPLGNSDPVCPHCSKQLTSMPSRKVRCRFCGNDIYVRTRPTDRLRVLVTAEDAARIDEERRWQLPAPRPNRPSAEEFDKEAAELAARFRRAPSEMDVCWSLANKYLLLHARRGDWELYRFVRLDMAELLRCEEKNREALDTYFEISYLEANGPRNMGGESDPSIIKEFPPFSIELAFQAPFVIEAIAKLSRALEIDEAGIKSAYLQVATDLKKRLRLPLSPETAWKHLRAELAKI